MMSVVRTLAKVCAIIAGLFVVLIAVMIIVEETGMDRISRESERKLQPVIRFVDGFIKDNGRLPSHEEFHRAADPMAWMVVLRTKDHPYAARKGAKTELDYMAGIWRADWYHYYKSWDHKFINAADETVDMMNGH
jgi:hypothetical protein